MFITGSKYGAVDCLLLADQRAVFPGFTHNHIATHFRRSAQRGGVASEISEDMIDHRHDIAGAVEARITLEEVQRATAQLPDAQRDVIALRFAVGLSIADTAKALGKREGNIKALQHKAVARLQKMLIPPPRQQEAVKRT